MKLADKVAFNTFIQIFAKATTVVFGLLTTVLLTGYLGREGFGDYMYVLTLVVLFGGLADWGTATIGVREASKAEKKQGLILGNLFLLRLFLALGAAGLMIIASFFLPFSTSEPVILRQAIWLGSLILILFMTKASLGMIFQTKLEMQNLAAADIAASFLTLSFSYFLVKNNFGLFFLVLAIVLANLAALLIAWILVRRTVKLVFRFDINLIKALFKESLPMGAILLMFTVDNKIDTVMLGAFQGNGAVGIYAIAYRVYDVLILGAHYLMAALLPVIASLADYNRFGTRLRLIYQKAFDVLLLMVIGVIFFVWVLAPWVVKFLTQDRFGEFSDAVGVLRFLSLALFFAYFNHLTGYTIVALGKQRSYFWVALTALFFNVFCNYLAIPRLTYYGAAGVTFLTEGLVFLITTFFIFRLLKIFPSVFSFPRTALELIKKKGKIF